jgi:peptidoglycan/xylan/chitin deacetylase (PgdA/CDA1 family)
MAQGNIMHETNLKIIKIILVILVMAVIFTMISGITFLKDNYYLRSKYFALQWNYLKTEVAFIEYNYGGIFNWVVRQENDTASNSAISEKAASVPVLLYHGVIDDPNWQSDHVNISLNDFRDQMFSLKKAGYQTITLAQFLSFMRGDDNLPAKPIIVTFDDARKDSFYPVDPILRTLNFNAVMFAITGRSIGEGNQNNVFFHLSEDELRKMKASGRWEINSHTQNGHDLEKIDANGDKGHFLTDKLWLDSSLRLETDEEYKNRIEKDLLGSKVDLEKNLGGSVLGFAYPFGDYGQGTQNFPGSESILISGVNSIFPLSFRQAGNQEFPENYPGKDFRLIKRINVNSDMSKYQLVDLLEGSLSKALPYRDSFVSNQGWLVAWGSSELKNGLFLTGAANNEDSSLTFLNGTYNWKDYTMNTNIQLVRGDAFAIAARYIDGNNYVSCDFSSGEASLTERVAGKERDISEAITNSEIIPNQSISVGVNVVGNKASCYIEGKAVASGLISPDLAHGGVGYKTWDRNKNNSSLLVSSLSVN